MSSITIPEKFNFKKGLYLKSIKNGKITINGKEYHVPAAYQTFIYVDDDNVYIADITGKPICKLSPVLKAEAHI
ncbi:MAG: hypothetical protein FWH53_00240 [Leptospirales bacterium]|nr:hypothetical protein [Leptospirales bacterium]